MNLNPQQIDGLLRMASSRLGVAPEELRRQLESGDIQRMAQKLTPQQQQQMTGLLRDPQAAAQLAQSPQVRQLLEQLRKGR